MRTEYIYQNRTDWTDDKWAAYLGCDVASIPELRNWLSDRYIATVGIDFVTKKYFFVISQRVFGLNGQSRLTSWRVVRGCDSRQSAIEIGTKCLIPNLQFGEVTAKMMGVPQNTPQMIRFVGKIK